MAVSVEGRARKAIDEWARIGELSCNHDPAGSVGKSLETWEIEVLEIAWLEAANWRLALGLEDCQTFRELADTIAITGGLARIRRFGSFDHPPTLVDIATVFQPGESIFEIANGFDAARYPGLDDDASRRIDESNAAMALESEKAGFGSSLL